MPHLPKIFKRKSSSSIKAKLERDGTDSPPPVPQIPQLVLSSSNSSSDPVFLQNGHGQDHTNGNVEQSSRPKIDRLDTSFSSTQQDRKALPAPPPSASPADPSAEMWKGIADAQAGKNISKSEKVVNKISDFASGAVDTAQSSSGVVGVIKTVIANEEVQAIGKQILDGIPAIMTALETLTDVHPFLKAAYLPFKLIYGQEMKRRENDQKRATLFEKIKDVMMVLLELKNVGKDEQRLTPDGTPLLSRVEDICNKMKKDIEDCYNVLNTQEKRSVAIKFLQASSWNGQLAGFAVKFEGRRGELQFALQLRTAAGVDEIRDSVNEMRAMFMQMFNQYKTPQEREIGQWIQNHGGEQAVLGSDEKINALIKKEANISSAEQSHTASVNNAGMTARQRVAALKKEYHEDIETAIADNFESYSKRFQMGMDQLSETLSAKISHEGDRIITYMQRGPHQRIKDKYVFRVWKEQGWRGSAKTRTLVLAIRDYFQERVEREKTAAGDNMLLSARPPPTPLVGGDEDDHDPELAAGTPLPDSWVLEYLNVKRLRGVQQVLDNDMSGWTTISELNAFTRSRPTGWSLPKWLGYWSVGWQIFATKQCEAIEDLFNQMNLLTTEISIKMPGNLPHILNYTEGMWGYVTSLTSAIERFETAPQWLLDHYQSYVDEKEATFKKRLEQINYDIDTIDTVNLILGQEHIEHVVFILVKLLMQRHLAKFHLSLREEMDAVELDDDFDSILWVLEAAWYRYLDLVDIFKHEQVTDLEQAFELFSCGLFSKYYEFQEWTSTTYWRNNEAEGNYQEDETIRPIPPEELEHILIHSNDGKDKEEKEETKSEEDLSKIDDFKKNLLFDITGTWYGFRWSEDTKPMSPMLCLKLVADVPTVPEPTHTPVTDRKNKRKSKKPPSVEVKLPFSGETTNHAEELFNITGTITVKDNFPDKEFSIEFELVMDDGTSFSYEGFLSPFKEAISGTVDGGNSGNFIFKRTSAPAALSFRPLEPGTLSAKQLWHFAYAAVVNQLKRSRPDMKYCRERLTLAKRTVKLLTASNVREVTEEETGYLTQGRLMFTPSEFREVYKLVQWYERVGNAQDKLHVCHNCGDVIVRSRIVCFDCEDSDNPENTVDLCHKRECVSSGPQDDDDKHRARHVLFKCRARPILKNWADSVSRARSGVEMAEGLYVPPPEKENNGEEEEDDEDGLAGMASFGELEAGVNGDNKKVEEAETNGDDQEWEEEEAEEAEATGDEVEDTSEEADSDEEGDDDDDDDDDSSEDSDEEDPEEMLKCLYCHDRVLAPCWYCLDCPDQYAFVCDKCEDGIDTMLPWDLQRRYRAETKDRSAHNVQHILVRFGQKGEDDSDSDSDDSDFKPELEAMEERLTSKLEELVRGQFGQLEEKVDKRITHLEERVTAGVEKLEVLLKALLQSKA